MASFPGCPGKEAIKQVSVRLSVWWKTIVLLFCSVGYPVVTMGFSIKSCISYRFRLVSIIMFFFRFISLSSCLSCTIMKPI